MDPLVDRAGRHFRHSYTPALALRDLTRRLADEPGQTRPTEDGLTVELHRHPERFRVIDPWKGAWRSLTPDRRQASTSPLIGPWVVPTDPPPPSESSRCLRLLDQSLHWIGRSVDDSSVIRMARWLRILHAGAELRPRVRQADAIVAPLASVASGYARDRRRRDRISFVGRRRSTTLRRGTPVPAEPPKP